MNTKTKMWLAVIVLVLAFEKAGSQIIDGCFPRIKCKVQVGEFDTTVNSTCCKNRSDQLRNYDGFCTCTPRGGGGITRGISTTSDSYTSKPTTTAQQPATVSLKPPSDSYTSKPTTTAQQPATVSLKPPSDSYIYRPTNTAQQPTNVFLVPWFLGLFLWLLGSLIQKIALDRPHQL